MREPTTEVDEVPPPLAKSEVHRDGWLEVRVVDVTEKQENNPLLPLLESHLEGGGEPPAQAGCRSHPKGYDLRHEEIAHRTRHDT